MTIAIDQATKLELFLDQFHDSYIMNQFTKAFLDESTELENLCQDLYDDRNLDSAVGVQLEQIGRLIGEVRNGRDDETYRQAIKLRIAINTSEGTVQDIINVLNLLYGDDVDVIIVRTGKALLSIYIGIDEPTEDLVPILQQTIPTGVKIDNIIYPSTRLPWIPTERGGVIQGTGILPEQGDNSPSVRIPPERVST